MHIRLKFFLQVEERKVVMQLFGPLFRILGAGILLVHRSNIMPPCIPFPIIQERGEAIVHFLNILPDGHVDLDHLDNLLSSLGEKALVSLMHANNETGNLLDIRKVAEIM